MNSNFDRAEHLKQVHNNRKALTHEKVDKAIQKLIKKKHLINFNTVSEESGVSKKTLYENEDIKERIEALRRQQSHVPKPSDIKQEMDEKNKDAIIASLKRKMKKIQEENTKLREQIKAIYAKIYDKELNQEKF